MKIEVLQSAMIQAMKEKNKLKKEVIADIIATAKNMAIEKGCKDNIIEEIVDAAILKAKKTCQEQIDTCPTDRIETLENYKLSMAYINEYAPKMMSKDEVREAALEILRQNEVANKGAAMKLVMPVLKGKADGKLINQVISELIDKNN